MQKDITKFRIKRRSIELKYKEYHDIAQNTKKKFK